MDYEKAIEIPFGANDSELIKWEYTIPKGMEAEIKDGKVIIKKVESEDEKIRKFLIDYFTSYKIGNVATKLNGYRIDDILAYLEKQKEQKPVHFELKAGKWYICHRAFCCRADHLTVKEGERFQCEKDGIVKGFVIKEPEKYFKECSAPAPMEDEQKEQKPAEWSEEDEDMLNSCISSIEEAKENRYAYKETDGDTSYDHEIAWLKLLRNRVGKEFLQPHWKPSEEQMRALLKVVDKARELHYSSNSGYDEYDVLRLLYKQLKEL